MPTETYHVLSTEIEKLLAVDGVELAWVRGPAGPGAPPHTHPWRETYVVTTGAIEVNVYGVTTVVTPGQSASVPASVPHAFDIVEDGTTFLLVSHSDRSLDFFADISAEVSMPPDLELVRKIAARHDVQLLV